METEDQNPDEQHTLEEALQNGFLGSKSGQEDQPNGSESRKTRSDLAEGKGSKSASAKRGSFAGSGWGDHRSSKASHRRGSYRDGLRGSMQHTDPTDGSMDSDSTAVEMADKCVGNGPGYGMADEPVRCTGKKLLKEVVTLNKMGKCFSMKLRSEPNLLAGGALSGALSATAPPGSADARRDLVVFRDMPNLTRTNSAKPLRPLQKLPEPYLLEVWEQHPENHKKPSEPELIRLGAIAPPSPQVSRLQQSQQLRGSDALETTLTPQPNTRPDGLLRRSEDRVPVSTTVS